MTLDDIANYFYNKVGIPYSKRGWGLLADIEDRVPKEHFHPFWGMMNDTIGND